MSEHDDDSERIVKVGPVELRGVKRKEPLWPEMGEFCNHLVSAADRVIRRGMDWLNRMFRR